MTATETATKIWTYETTETDTKTETATETQTYLATVTQGMSRVSCDLCFKADFYERVVYTKIVPTTYLSVWESTVTKDLTHTIVETKSKTGGFFPQFSSCLSSVLINTHSH